MTSDATPGRADLAPPAHLLPDGVRSRTVSIETGLTMHVLEAGDADRPLLLLLHGFPELAFSWRNVMPALAAAGYHVVAPDQRGYGATTGWDGDDVASFAITRIAADALALAAAMGHTHIHGLVGHDFGSFAAGTAAMARPDLVRSVVMMSAPWSPPPPFRLGGPATAIATDPNAFHRDLAALERPRKHYQWYYSGPDAARDMIDPPEGLHAFLRAYFHMKSGDWVDNQPEPLGAWSADNLARLPAYYVMDLADTMPDAVRPHMPSAEAIAACHWLPDEVLVVYANAFEATGFQASLNWYTCRTSGLGARALAIFSGCRIVQPAAFIAGARDWGIHQTPGALERLADTHCVDFHGTHLIAGAGHWVQQEAVSEVNRHLLAFLCTV